MSLIRARRSRRKQARRGMPARRLVMLLALTIGVIWYLGWAF